MKTELGNFLAQKRDLLEDGVVRSDTILTIRDVAWRLASAKKYADLLSTSKIKHFQDGFNLASSDIQDIQKVIDIAKKLDLRTIEKVADKMTELNSLNFRKRDWFK